LWAGFNSAIASADPADITGPDDLPGLLINFIENLPIIGEIVSLMESIISGDFNPADVVTAIENVFNTLGAMLGLPAPDFDSSAAFEWFAENIPVAAGLVEAMMGTYTGDDDTLLTIQEIFGPIRALVAAVEDLDLSSPEAFLASLVDAIIALPEILAALLSPLVGAITGIPGDLSDLETFLSGKWADVESALGVDALLQSLRDAIAHALGHFGGEPYSSGDVEGFLGATFDALVPLDELVDTLTGIPGDLPDLADWVDDIPSLSEVVEAATGAVGGLTELSSWAQTLTPLAALDELKAALGGSFGDGVADIIDRLENMLTPSSAIPGANIVGDIVDDVVPGIGQVLDNIFQSVTGLASGGVSHAQMQSALAAQTAALTGVAAQVARLNTAFTGGVSAYDDFEAAHSGDLGAGWSLAYSSGPGNIYCDGHNAAWNPGVLTATPRTVRARWLGANATSSSDYQRVELILNSVPENPLIGSPAANDILLRMDSGGTNFVRVRFRGDNVVLISRVVSGTETVMNSGSLTVPMVAGASLAGEAGKLGTARYFRALMNGFPVLEVTEGGTASLVGSSYRGWGLGMFAGSNNVLIVIPAQSKPGQVKQWTASDLTL
jgi:hypothetical protein